MDTSLGSVSLNPGGRGCYELDVLAIKCMGGCIAGRWVCKTSLTLESNQ